MRPRLLFLFAPALLAAAACNGGGSSTTTGTTATGGASSTTATSSGTGGTTATGDLPCDVDAVLGASCRSCHGASPSYGSPMSLVTYADLVAPAPSDPTKKVYELVGARTHDAQKPMPPAPNARLDAAAQHTLDAWIAAGAPASTDHCAAPPDGGTGGAAPGCTPDLTLRPAASYTMPATASDMYICYGVDVTVAQKRHITTFLPHVDNSKIVHHIVLFEAQSAAPAGPSPCSFGSTNMRMVAVWAPGNPGFTLPPEAGLPIEGTTHYVLQVHYNNVTHLSGESDASGFDLCTTDQLRPNDADILAFGSVNFSVPAHGATDVTCSFPVPAGAGPYHVIGAMPHMHKLGTVIETGVYPGGSGTAVDLGTRNPWNFDTQYWSPLDVTVNGGDTVRTRCAWSNPGASAVGFGENTEDEMCFTFELYYPKITSPGWNWGVPAYTATCGPTP
jgi:hypothetical protein